MDAYLEITLRPDPEFGPQLLLGALVGKLHRGLVLAGTDAIGVSFPDHSHKPRSLGGRLRLHGSAAELDGFMAHRWLAGMADHLTISDIQPVPDSGSHRVVRRVQPKTNAERLRRRYRRRHGVTEEEARCLIPDTVEKPVPWPFVTLQSASTGQRFALFVEHGPLQREATTGCFNAYGLGQTATVPWF
jgi:CRISPR-associated endonuclease Csy4